MSASLYFLAVPLSVITVSALVVKRQDSSFTDTSRTGDTQVVNRRSESMLPPSFRKPEADELPRAEAVDPVLGREAVLRPLGSRGSMAVDWLDLQKSARNREMLPAPEIERYVEQPPAVDPLAESLTSGSGYDITAEEVTKMDIAGSKVVFNKNVRLISPTFQLTSKQLVVYLGEDKSTMRIAEAHGDVNVRLTGVPPESAYCGQSTDATFDPAKDTLVLTGWPRVKGASKEQVAVDASTRMTLFTKSGRMLTDGRALTRVSKSFMDQSTAAPAAAAAPPQKPER